MYFKEIILRGFFQYGKRCKRLLVHPIQYFVDFSHLKSRNVVEFLGDFFFYVLDCLFIPELHDIIYQSLFPGRSRKFNQHEVLLVKKIFQNAIDTRYCFVNNRAFSFTKRYAMAYVGFSTIYFRDIVLEPHVFIHECVHLWQFQQFGSIYIFRAMIAHMKGNPYHYGGLNKLSELKINNFRFANLNFEQQAQLIEDYYLWLTRHRNHPNVSPAGLTYQYFLKQMQKNQSV